jgi:Rad3-related DNA helicase
VLARAASRGVRCCSAVRRRPRRVLVGSHSFWEGIDMPGDALQCVLIDKLPFPPPNDPLVEARVKQLQAQGRNPSTTTSSPRPRCR